MTGKTKDDAVAKTTEAVSFPALADRDLALATLSEAGDMGLTTWLLTHAKVPAGGGTAWQIPNEDGDDDVQKSIRGVIVAVQSGLRRWYRADLGDGGGGSPPDCTSEDGITGIGNNTLDPDSKPGRWLCADCAWSKFGSARNGGRGQDCKQSQRIYIYQEGSLLPMVVDVPPTSLKAIQTYGMRLLSRGRRLSDVVTEFTLRKERNAGGIDYAQIEVKRVGDVDPDMARTAKLLGDECKKLLVNSAAIRQGLGETIGDDAYDFEPEA